jgi:hypothetical protein
VRAANCAPGDIHSPEVAVVEEDDAAEHIVAREAAKHPAASPVSLPAIATNGRISATASDRVVA